MSAERTVTAKLRADVSGYLPGVEAASKSTSELALAQKEAAASAKASAVSQSAAGSSAAEAARSTRLLTNAKREAVDAARAATAADAEASRQLVAAQREVAAAAKDTTELGAERRAAAQVSLDAAQKEAVAAAEAKAAAEGQAKSATAALVAHKDQAAAARETAVEETASAKASEEAAKKRTDAYANTGKKMMAAGAALGAAFVLAEKATSDFDKSLSGVQAVSNASAAEMDKLRGAALQAGKDTAFTATEAADAEGELVKAGVSVADVLNGGLKGALSLAAAGQLDLADAATISANAMNTFGLHGSDVSHIADVLAAAANKSAADVKELAYGMQQGGLVAAQTGLTFEDTSAVLAAFADRGLKGADAGTSLKTMLEKLNAPTTQARDLMQQLGIVTYDSQGKFVGIEQVAGQLKDKMGGLTDAQRNQAMATIFGTDAIRAASVLYNLGADGVKGYRDAVNDSGAASRMAALQMDNLSGDLKQLKGSIDVALIQGGSGANNVLRDMAKFATNAVNAFANLPKPLQEAGVGFAGGGGAALLLVGGLTSIAGKAASTKKTLSEVAEASKGMKGALASAGSFMAGPWGLAIAGAATVVGIFASEHSKAKEAVTNFTDAIKEDGNAIGDATTKAVAADLAQKGLLGTYDKLGVSSATVTDAALGSADALQKVTDATSAALKANKDNLPQISILTNALHAVKSYSGALHEQLKTQQQATAATQESTAATGVSADETQRAAQEAKDSAAAIYAAAGVRRAFADAEDDGTEATKSSTTAVKAHTAAHGDNTKALNAAAAATKAHDAAAKADATTQKDFTRATDAQNKANDAAAKSEAAAAAAAKVNGDAHATAAEKKKANAAASKAAAAASRAQATADKDSTSALDAAAAAADKHTAANAKSAKASKAAADAAKTHGDTSQKTAEEIAAEAEAAREATEVHKVGVPWLQAVADAETAAGESARDLDDSVKNEVLAMKDAKSKATDLKDALDALNGVHIAASRAALDVQDKIAGLTKALHDNGTTMDITSDKGRANMGVVLDLAQAINNHAQAVAEESGSVEAGNKALDASREEFDKVLQSAGVSKDKIKDFNDTLLNTPKLTDVKIDADTSAAAAKLQALADKYGYIQVQVGGGSGGRAAYATGGLVIGAGTGTSDSNMVAVSNKEYIVRASAVARPGVLAELDKINFGTGNTSVVKPQIPMTSLSPTASPGASTGAAGLHIENYFENGAPPSAIAAELAWLTTARGGSW